MSVNLLPWRENLHIRRKRCLLIVSGITVALGLGVMLGGWMVWQIREARSEKESLHHQSRIERLQKAYSTMLAEQVTVVSLLDQMKALQWEHPDSLDNHTAWQQWIRRGLESGRLTLSGWLGSSEELEIHFQLHGEHMMQTLAPLLDETGAQLTEVNANGEEINVVINMSAMD
jgi:Tfp pilus assembly protein PilN